jgi:hypothetical protein
MTGAPPLPTLTNARALPSHAGTDHPVKIAVDRLNFYYGARGRSRTSRSA